MPREAMPAKMQALYDALDGASDVHVLKLYEAVMGHETNDHRRAQQHMSSYFIRLNRRLRSRGLRVSPGILPATYRLCELAD